MRRVEIHVPRTAPASIDVRHILTAIGEPALRARWRLSEVMDCLGSAGEDIDALAAAGSWVDGDRLAELFGSIYQSLEGELDGYRPQEPDPWVRITCVRGDSFDVETDDSSTIQQLLKAFPTSSLMDDAASQNLPRPFDPM
jgi:hypothetical protein